MACVFSLLDLSNSCLSLCLSSSLSRSPFLGDSSLQLCPPPALPSPTQEWVGVRGNGTPGLKIRVSTPFLILIIPRHDSGPQPSPSPLPRSPHPTELEWTGDRAIMDSNSCLQGDPQHLLSLQNGDPCPSYIVPPPCLSPTPIADAMKGCRGESPVGGREGSGGDGELWVGPKTLLSLSLPNFLKEKTQCSAPSPGFPNLQLGSLVCWTHLLLLPYWRVWEIHKQRR